MQTEIVDLILWKLLGPDSSLIDLVNHHIVNLFIQVQLGLAWANSLIDWTPPPAPQTYSLLIYKDDTCNTARTQNLNWDYTFRGPTGFTTKENVTLMRDDPTFLHNIKITTALCTITFRNLFTHARLKISHLYFSFCLISKIRTHNIQNIILVHTSHMLELFDEKPKCADTNNWNIDL